MARLLFDPLLIKDPPDTPRHSLLTVTQLTALVKRALKKELPSQVHVLGEVSNFKVHSSGHLYFTLKDASSELACVMWRSAAGYLKYQPQDGMQVVATGEIEVFDRAGKYQLYVRRLEPKGTGALELAFRQLCEQLRKEGLFDDRHKKDIPAYPKHIAIITSPTGAAIRDMLQTFRRRYPCLTVSLYPVAVQGEKAAGEISAAIKRLNQQQKRLGGIDVMIVGRGGGSLEDLWAFNEEVVARAIFRSQIPVISAVGHEVDITVSDLVADLRAATPSAAAELAVPVKQELLEQLRNTSYRLNRVLAHYLSISTNTLNALSQREPLRAPQRMIQQRAQYLDHLHSCTDHVMKTCLHLRRELLSKLETTLRTIEPHRYLTQVHTRALGLGYRLLLLMSARLQCGERRLSQLSQRLAGKSPYTLMAVLDQRLVAAQRALAGGMRSTLQRNSSCLEALVRQLQSVSYRRTLSRGYSVTRLAKTGKLVTSANQVTQGDVVRTETASGDFGSTVNQVTSKQKELFD